MANPIIANRHQNPQKPPLLLGACEPPFIHRSLGRSHSPPQTTSRSIHAISHNYAINSPLVSTGCPTFIAKTAPSSSTISTHLIHPSLGPRPTPLTTPSRSNQLFFHNSPTGQTDRPTDGPSDEIGDKSVPTAACGLLIV